MAASSQSPTSGVNKPKKDIFISYSREEGVSEFAKKLKRNLEENGLSVWLDVDDISTGSDFHVEIDVALKSCRALIPILTKKYVHSRYCEGELGYVANSQNKVLLPVIYEDGWEEGEEGAEVNHIVAGHTWTFFRPNRDDHQESLNKLIHCFEQNLGGAVKSLAAIETGTAIPASMITAVSCIEKWQELGHQLNVDPEKLSNLLKSGCSGAECRDEMMEYWQRHDKDASWEKLVRALKRMGESQLADRILYQHGAHLPVVAPSRPPITNQESNMMMGDLVIFSKEIIGQGGFGTVFKGRWRDKPCAAKMLSILGNEVYTGVCITQPGAVQEEALARFKQECEFMKKLLHPNIVTYYDMLIHPGSNLPVLVMELMDMSLRHYLSSLESLSKKVQLYLCHNIAAALDFLHCHNLIHRDLCGDNILLKCSSSDLIPVAKVTDFGMSRFIMKRSEMTRSLTAIGHRPGYLPPEAPKEHTDYDSSLDVFMFGAVMTQIACKQPTIKSKDERKLLVNQLVASRHPLKPIIAMCLNERKERRPNARTLCGSLQYACESLATEGNTSGDQDMDSIANKMQQLCLEQQSGTKEAKTVGANSTDGTVPDVSTQITSFRRKFETLALSCLSELEETHLGLRKFRTSLTLLPACIKLKHTAFLKENLPTLLRAEGLEEVFMHLNLYWNFIDYSLLDDIIDHFCSDKLKKDMSEYKSDLGQFCRVTTIGEIIHSWPGRVEPPPSFTEFTNTLDRDASTFTLEELEQLRLKICSEFTLFSFILLFRGVVEGSLVITWAVPSSIVAELRQNLLEKARSKCFFFEENAIMSVSIDGECVSVFGPQTSTPLSWTPNTSFSHSKVKKGHSEVEVFTAESMAQLQEQIESKISGESEHLWKLQSTSEENNPWEIYVRTLTGKIITVWCNEMDQIADIKSKIERKEGIPLGNQQLVKRETHEDSEKGTQIVNVTLDDHVSLSDYHIQNYQELILMRVDPSVHKVVLPVLPGVERPVVVPELATINVQSSSGEKYTVKIDISAKVREMKSVLSKQLGFELAEQRLIFDGNELQNDSVLHECNVRDGSTVHLVMLHFRDRVIYIKMLNGNSFTLECKAHNTIGTIKAMIHDEELIPADQQRLVFAGQALDNDRKTLTDYNIKHMDVIHLAFKRGGSLPLSKIGVGKIFVKAPYHAPMRVDVQSSDTVANVKIKVQRILVDLAADDQEEFPEFVPHEQELMLAGKRLNNDLVLGDLGIKDGDTLHLLFTRRQRSLEEIVIKTFSGDSFTIQVTPSDTVETVKIRIHERRGISPESQKLIYTGRELENHTKLSELNVHTATTFYLEVLQPPKIYIKPLMGEQIVLDFDPNVMVADVKSEIHEKAGVNSNQISLLFKGRELEDGQTLVSCGIQDKSTIYMFSTVTIEPVVFVKVPSLQKTVLLGYDPEATIRSIKLKLCEKVQISFEEQRLLFEGECLEDNGTLGSYNVPQEGTIDLIVTKMKDTVTVGGQDFTDLHIIEDYSSLPDVM